MSRNVNIPVPNGKTVLWIFLITVLAYLFWINDKQTCQLDEQSSQIAAIQNTQDTLRNFAVGQVAPFIGAQQVVNTVINEELPEYEIITKAQARLEEARKQATK